MGSACCAVHGHRARVTEPVCVCAALALRRDPGGAHGLLPGPGASEL